MSELPHDLVSPVEAAFMANVSLPTIVRAIQHHELQIYGHEPLTPGAQRAKATWLSKAEVKRWRDGRKAGAR
jgi:hypothetical protein